MNWIKFSFFVVIVLSSSIDVDAQRRKKRTKQTQRFSVGLITGIAFTQIDGDLYTGYDRKTLTGGFEVSAYLNEYLTFDINFLYTQKGANIENEEVEFRANYPKDRQIHLNYVELPFLLTLKPKGYGSKLYLESGISLNKMISSSILENVRSFTDVSFKKLEPEFKNSELGVIAGIGSYITQRFSIGFRSTYAMSKFYTNNAPWQRVSQADIRPLEVLFLRNYYLSVTLRYDIF